MSCEPSSVLVCTIDITTWHLPCISVPDLFLSSCCEALINGLVYYAVNILNWSVWPHPTYCTLTAQLAWCCRHCQLRLDDLVNSLKTPTPGSRNPCLTDCHAHHAPGLSGLSSGCRSASPGLAPLLLGQIDCKHAVKEPPQGYYDRTRSVGTKLYRQVALQHFHSEQAQGCTPAPSRYYYCLACPGQVQYGAWSQVFPGIIDQTMGNGLTRTTAALFILA